MRTKYPNMLWLNFGAKVGIKCFPRGGSTTIQETYGRGGNYGDFMVKPHRICVVRDPWDRLMSVWFGMVRSGNFASYGFVKEDNETLEDFLDWLVDQDPYEQDAHVTAMWAFLEGWWEPRDDELITMDDFFAQPPHGLPRVKIHRNRTTYPRKIEVPERSYNRWFNALGEKDYELFERAQKSPLGAGGKQATDDGHG